MRVSGHNESGLDGFAGEAVVGERSNGKRIFARGFKEALVARCGEPGVSVAALSMAHGINANLVRRWMKELPRQDRLGKVSKPVKASAALIAVDVQPLEPRGAMIEAPEKFPARRASSGATRRPTQPLVVQPRAGEAASSIEIQAHGACVRLHGEIDAGRLAVVLDVLARRSK